MIHRFSITKNGSTSTGRIIKSERPLNGPRVLSCKNWMYQPRLESLSEIGYAVSLPPCHCRPAAPTPCRSAGPPSTESGHRQVQRNRPRTASEPNWDLRVHCPFHLDPSSAAVGAKPHYTQKPCGATCSIIEFIPAPASEPNWD